MPLYEYICPECKKEFEEIQKFSDPPLKKCPHCGGKKVQKKMSLTSFQLKGTGWYVTDFRDKGKKKEEKTKSEPKPLKTENAPSTPSASESKSVDTSTKVEKKEKKETAKAKD